MFDGIHLGVSQRAFSPWSGSGLSVMCSNKYPTCLSLTESTNSPTNSPCLGNISQSIPLPVQLDRKHGFPGYLWMSEIIPRWSLFLPIPTCSTSVDSRSTVKLIMSSSLSSSDISKLMALIVVVLSGQQRTLILSNSVVIQVKEDWDDIRLCRIKPIKPEKGFTSAKHSLEDWVFNMSLHAR